ncbi:hypothetical protein [Nocardioides sp.]|uniref:hypothetical protein n=1 Tax=Nocardioides sp. TaxID=35761 RepID=UPI002625FD3B|nr:hypothetical protein [Nocardioides sp.]
MHTGVSTAPLAFFSFPEVTDPGRHQDYNAWHQLDHLPENRALGSVLHGERWVRTPACREASAALGLPADSTLDAAHYVAMYWFAEGVGGRVEPGVKEWKELGESTRLAGRRPELDWTVRRLTGMFCPEHGVVAPRALVSVGALPLRPHRGIVLDVALAEDPEAPMPETRAEDLGPGVAGEWLFTSTTVTPTPVGDGTGLAVDPGEGRLRIRVQYCDGDPFDVLGVSAPASPGTTTLLRTPLLPIQPWEWDWFDAESPQAGAGQRE